MRRRLSLMGAIALLVPALLGTDSSCASTLSSGTASPSMDGTWEIEHEDFMEVKITLGDTTYERELVAGGGIVELTHEDQAFTFDIDCARPDVVCPNELWSDPVRAEHPSRHYPHRVHMPVPTARCVVGLVEADESRCGPDTHNPLCKNICPAGVSVHDADGLGLTSEEGESFRMCLAADFTTEGRFCAPLFGSSVFAELVNSGDRGTSDWIAIGMRNGRVGMVFSGRCLFTGEHKDPTASSILLKSRVEISGRFHRRMPDPDPC